MCKFTVHSKFRYSNRFLDTKFKDENAYKKYIHENPDWEQQIISQMKNLFNNSELIYTGQIGNSDKDCNYYANTTDMITFVVDIKNESILTCYKIFYDLNDKLDKEMAKNILKEIHSYQKKKDKEDIKIKKQIDKLDFNITSTKNEMDKVKNILKTLENKINTFEQEKELKTKDIQMTEYYISKLATKLCYSVELLNDLN